MPQDPLIPSDMLQSNSAGPVWAAEIDARGLACPLPLLKAKQGLQGLVVGQCLRILATDKGSVRDFQAFTALSEHTLRYFYETAECFEYVIEKGQKP